MDRLSSFLGRQGDHSVPLNLDGGAEMSKDSSSESLWHGPRVSVRALMFLVFLIAAGLGWTVHRARLQSRLAAEIEKAGGYVRYDFEITRRSPRYLKWLARRVWIDYLGNVVEIDLPGDLSDVELAVVGRFPRLEQFRCYGSHASVSDAGLAHLDGLSRLKKLDLSASRLTDAGLVHLQGMSSLQELNLSRTGITDAGLVHLTRLTSLQTLRLCDTDVGEAGVAHLKTLTNLQSLDLWGTAVDDFVVQDMRRALPKVQVVFKSIMAR